MTHDLSDVSTCEVCHNDQLVQVLDLGLNPMCDDLVAVGENRVCREYPIEILFCERCLTALQRYQVPKLDLFPEHYHYRSRFTADVLTGMAQLVQSAEARFGSLSGKSVLDIGCNDGSLLDVFRTKGCQTFGIEPTGAYLDAENKQHTVYNKYLSVDVAETFAKVHGQPDFITFTNVFAHIEDLGEVIDALKALMGKGTKLIIENHYLGAVLNGHQFDTFYHEHPRTYSFSSFLHVARSLGHELLAVEFPARYGGNIRVFLGQGSPVAEAEKKRILATEQNFVEDFSRLSDNLRRWRQKKRQFFDDQVQKHGKLRAKAFPGRAGILVKLLGLDEKLIDAVYEKPGSLKIGHYLPGTRIPIRSDDELFALPDQAQPIVNLAWHIGSEIKSYLEKHGYKGPVLDILSADDF